MTNPDPANVPVEPDHEFQDQGALDQPLQETDPVESDEDIARLNATLEQRQ